MGQSLINCSTRGATSSCAGLLCGPLGCPVRELLPSLILLALNAFLCACSFSTSLRKYKSPRGPPTLCRGIGLSTSAICDFDEHEITIKREGKTLAYGVQLNGKQYDPKTPHWTKTDEADEISAAKVHPIRKA